MGNQEIEASNKTKEEIVEGFSLRLINNKASNKTKEEIVEGFSLVTRM